MWGRVARLRAGWVSLSLVTALVVLAGGVTALKKLDLEHRQADTGLLEKLAAAPLPPPQANRAEATDWPQWRGPNRDGLSPETGLLADWPAAGPRVLWRKPIGRGFSSVAVARGRLYTMDEETAPAPHQEAVVCLDAATGEELWRFRYPNHYQERFGDGPRSTPAVDGNLVYAVGPTGILHCLRAETGERLWRHDLKDEFQARPSQYGMSFSPLVEGDLVIATPGGPAGNSVAAFDKHSGALVWKALDDPIGYSSPVAATLAGVRQLLVFTNTALVSLAPADGKENWRYPWKTDNGFNIATPIVCGNYVFISSGYGKGCGLIEVAAAPDGSLRPSLVYEHNRMRNYFASSVRLGEHLYGFDMMDLVCMSIRTGEIVWREKGARSFRKGSLLIADGRLILLSEGGVLVLAAATPEGYAVKGSLLIAENKFWTVPSLAGGRLYVRNESQIVCLDLRK